MWNEYLVWCFIWISDPKQLVELMLRLWHWASWCRGWGCRCRFPGAGPPPRSPPRRRWWPGCPPGRAAAPPARSWSRCPPPARPPSCPSPWTRQGYSSSVFISKLWCRKAAIMAFRYRRSVVLRKYPCQNLGILFKNRQSSLPQHLNVSQSLQ